MKTSIRRSYLEKKNKEELEYKYIKKDNNRNDKNNKYQKNDYINQVKTTKKFFKEGKEEINIHAENLKQIEILIKELNNINNQNKLISKEINSLKIKQKNKVENYNKIINDINKQKLDLNKIKEIYNEKNREYIQLRNQHREMMIRNIRSIHRDSVNELNRNSLHHFFDRLVFLSRMRRDNNSGPVMTDEQLQALPISYYPRNNNSNEKCIICDFPFCYNDVIINLRSCHHIFHKACLINSLTLSRSSNCPICRTTII